MMKWVLTSNTKDVTHVGHKENETNWVRSLSDWPHFQVTNFIIKWIFIKHKKLWIQLKKKTAITQFKPNRRNLSTDSTFGQSGLMINLHHDLSMCVDSDLLFMNFHIRRFSGRESEKEGWQFRRLGHFGDRKRKWRVEVTSLLRLSFLKFF